MWRLQVVLQWRRWETAKCGGDNTVQRPSECEQNERSSDECLVRQR